VELLFNGIDCAASIKFTNDQGLLKDPNIWFADTAASMHMSPHINGMINMQQNKTNGITVGHGEVMIVKQRGDILSELCDSKAVPIMHATIKDVVVNKNFPFHLLSLTKLMKQGWILGGDKNNGITLT
jgi:hypothetical protein